MSPLRLTKTGMKSGIWRGLLTGSRAIPKVLVTHLGKPVADVTLTASKEKDTWLVQVPVPPEAVSDGVQTILISDMETHVELGSFALIAGEALEDDLRVEVDLLRAELDMLKSAFRRHCSETT